MANYRYLFADLLTNQVLAELPLTNVTFTQELNGIGSMSGQLLLSDARTANVWGTYANNEVFTLDNDTAAGKTALYVERDGNLVWGGIVWGRPYDSESQMMMFGAREFLSYFEHRRITSTVVFPGDTSPLTPTDQFTIVKSLVDIAQAASYGNIGVVTSGIGTSGFSIPQDYLVYYGYEQKIVFDAIKELSRQAATSSKQYGFDFSIDVAYDANMNPTKTLNLYCPRKGASANPNNPYAPMLEFPGSVTAYSYAEDGGHTANTVYGIGPSSTDSLYISTASSTTSFAAGYPLLEDVVSFTQIQNPLMVDQLTAAEVNARYKPVVLINASWSPTTNPLTGVPAGPNWGEFSLGDTFRIRITDDRFPGSAEFFLRLQSFNVSVGDDGSSELINGVFVESTY